MKSNDIITIVILIYVILLLGIWVYSNFKYQAEECQKRYQNCTVLSDFYINYIVCNKNVVDVYICKFHIPFTDIFRNCTKVKMICE